MISNDKIKMLYDAKLSVEDNAERCEVSVPTMNLWLRMNGVNRLFDSMYLKWKQVKQVQKQHPSWSRRKIAKETGYAINTVRKYYSMDKFEKPVDEDRISTFDTSKSKFLIKSISDDQQEILNNIIKLYIKEGYIQADFTFSKGIFYKDNKVIIPTYRFDKYPKQCEGVLDLKKADKLIEDGALHSCIVDLPFLVTKKEWTKNCKMHQRFNSFNDIKEATEANKAMLKLSYEKLQKKGIMIMKTQDLFTAGHQIWMSHLVHQWAVEQGFDVIDKFILTSDMRMLSSGMNQKCARKYHSYFFVFQKKK
jgi:hypothetical protein